MRVDIASVRSSVRLSVCPSIEVRQSVHHLQSIYPSLSGRPSISVRLSVRLFHVQSVGCTMLDQYSLFLSRTPIIMTHRLCYSYVSHHRRTQLSLWVLIINYCRCFNYWLS